MTGSELRSIRLHLGLSQANLGAKLGISRSMVWCYENNRTKIPDSLAHSLRMWVSGNTGPSEPDAELDDPPGTI